MLKYIEFHFIIQINIYVFISECYMVIYTRFKVMEHVNNLFYYCYITIESINFMLHKEPFGPLQSTQHHSKKFGIFTFLAHQSSISISTSKNLEEG